MYPLLSLSFSSRAAFVASISVLLRWVASSGTSRVGLIWRVHRTICSHSSHPTSPLVKVLFISSLEQSQISVFP